MKKSEYRAARLRVHEREPWIVSKAARVQKDVEAAEAAGVVWDPEEEPLPEKLEAVYNVQWLLMVPLPPAPCGPCKRFLSEAEAQEAVRRYNAWPELEMAESMGPGMGLCGGCEIFFRKLEAILQGRAS